MNKDYCPKDIESAALRRDGIVLQSLGVNSQILKINTMY